MKTPKSGSAAAPFDVPNVDHFRFHRPHAHLATAFGNDSFALKAEAFARFFGTPLFLGAQTVIVAIWIAVNALGFTRFDVYPFILLNLAFSLQAAYAAPLILLAQTRQRETTHTPTLTRNTGRLLQSLTSSGRQLPRKTRHNCWSCCSGIRN